MTSQYRHRRSPNPATNFTALEPGEIAVNTATRQLSVGDADGTSIGIPLPLLAIRIFDARSTYVWGITSSIPACFTALRARHRSRRVQSRELGRHRRPGHRRNLHLRAAYRRHHDRAVGCRSGRGPTKRLVRTMSIRRSRPSDDKLCHRGDRAAGNDELRQYAGCPGRAQGRRHHDGRSDAARRSDQ